ncbi:hypothetical protein Anapl_12305 [Anas platyrhynchos]|uniref:Uncharacterized protein n=1 Tax=Anas platyrhynchos TaxID=8839 RepID=R0KZ27_ANAPL|nr:hypothetical protein Anapl_12305 [Anas platyrhynchos]
MSPAGAERGDRTPPPWHLLQQWYLERHQYGETCLGQQDEDAEDGAEEPPASLRMLQGSPALRVGHIVEAPVGAEPPWPCSLLQSHQPALAGGSPKPRGAEHREPRRSRSIFPTQLRPFGAPALVQGLALLL